MVLAFSGIVVFLLTLVARTYRHPVTTGQESIIGREGTVKVAVSPKSPGKVLVFGEYWNAVSDSSLEPGERIRVVSREGMVLKVVPYKKGENDAQH